tara:strand:- start:295 stop:483 length:189 start_codon:yes stop_codon:yes gene_type:complete
MRLTVRLETVCDSTLGVVQGALIGGFPENLRGFHEKMDVISGEGALVLGEIGHGLALHATEE